MNHKQISSLCVLFGVALYLFWHSSSTAKAEPLPKELHPADKLIRSNAKMIGFFALPTYTYVDIGYHTWRKMEKGGFELSYTLEFEGPVTVKMAFYLDSDGSMKYLKVVRENAYWNPFTDAVGSSQLKTLRKIVHTHPGVKQDVDLIKQADSANAQDLCILYLQLEQKK
ncbi:MAG: hypothetical protein ACFCD0_16900 [Gemmataceae bacterium]